VARKKSIAAIQQQASLVPTLCVGTSGWGRSASFPAHAAERRGLRSHAERGNEGTPPRTPFPLTDSDALTPQPAALRTYVEIAVRIVSGLRPLKQIYWTEESIRVVPFTVLRGYPKKTEKTFRIAS
jgi:hypothetical protein